MEKYFTPEISDLRVGYECEIQTNHGYETFNKGEELWRKVVIEYKDEEDAYTNELTNIIHLFDDGVDPVRVAYLTKEQIEAEGWETCETWFTKDYPGITTHSGEYFLNDVFVPYGHSELFYNFETLELTIQDIHGYTVFKGRCPDINTFRYICKLIGI